MVEDAWANNGGVRLQYRDSNSGASSELVPLLFVPGMLGSAEQYETELAALAPRRCLAISLRGRGQSDAPAVGYGVRDHATDIAAVVGHARLGPFCLMAYSQSVPFALAYAARHPRALAGLIIGDYPAAYPAMPPAWVERVRARAEPAVRPGVAEALQHESASISLWEELPTLACPVLVLSGGQPDARLKPADIERYRRLLPDVEVVIFPAAGHELWRPNYEDFIRTIEAFLVRLDGRH